MVVRIGGNVATEIIGVNYMVEIIMDEINPVGFSSTKKDQKTFPHTYGVEISLESVTNLKSIAILLLTWTFR